MKKAGCLMLVVALALVVADVPMVGAEGVHDTEPVFGKTFTVLSDSVWAIKGDGTLWLWREHDEEDEKSQWPAMAAEEVSRIDRSFTYGLKVEKQDGIYLCLRETWRNNVAVPPLTCAKEDDETLAWQEKVNEFSKYNWWQTKDTSDKWMGILMTKDGSVLYCEQPDLEASKGFLWETPGEKPPAAFEREVPLMADGCRSFFVLADERSTVFMLCDDGSLWRWAFPKTYGGDFPAPPEKILSDVASIQNDASPNGGGANALFALAKDGTLWDCTNEAPKKVIEDVAVFAYDWAMRAVVKSDGSLWTWGWDSFQAVRSAYVEKPVHVMDDVVDVQIEDYILALKADGTLWMWGGNSYLPLSRLFPDRKDRFAPVKIMDGVAIPGTPAHFPSSWAKDEVAKAKEAGLIPDAFRSWYQRDVTRAEFAALAAALIEKTSGQTLGAFVTANAAEDTVTFTDTGDANVLALAALGVVNGVGGGRFAPDRTITREEAARLLRNTAGVLKLPAPEQTPAFTDGGQVADWAKEGVSFVSGHGVMNGVGQGRFSPKMFYTREMSILTFWRLFQALDKI